MKDEFERELKLLETDGLKTHPLRLEYEEKVRLLCHEREQLIAEGYSTEEVAKRLHNSRRKLGKLYKDAAPPLFREYIFYATEQKYKDPLGPSYETLRKIKSPEQIIEAATRPIHDLSDRLTIEGFKDWFYQVYQNEISDSKTCQD